MAIKPKKRKEGEGERKKRRRPSEGDRPRLAKKRPGDKGYDPYDFTSSDSEGEESAPPTSQSHDKEDEAMETGPVQMSAERSVISSNLLVT